MINDSSTIELTAITLFKSSSTWSHLFTFNNEKNHWSELIHLRVQYNSWDHYPLSMGGLTKHIKIPQLYTLLAHVSFGTFLTL